MSLRLHRWTREPVLVTSILVVVFVTINVIAVWGIVSGRRAARQAAQNELVLRTRADARSLEAILATLRGDFLLISQSLQLRTFLESRAHEDPMLRRWNRLDVESTLLLFVEAHPSIERLELESAGGDVLTVAGRRRGVPELLPAERSEPPAGRAVFEATFASPSGGKLVAWLDPQALLAISSPRHVDHLRVDRDDASPPPAPGQLSAQMPVTDESWEPPIAWWLVRREEENELLLSVETLAERYRTTVVLNLAVMTLTLVLGGLALRQVRRVTRLEAENEQEKRVRELERQLMHSERLASVGRLAAGFAHEINNPLEGMTNYLALLSDDLAAGRTEDAPKLVERVREGLERTAGITRQVLAFSGPDRPPPGENTAPKDRVDLAALLRDAIGFVQSSRDYGGVEMRLDAPAPLLVHGNPVTLGQLFLNLLLNACQAQEGGGTVDVRAGSNGSGEAVVTVADRGPGLNGEALGHLFEPFYSTRGSTGLGLAVCHGVVADHDGRIEGRNRAEGGAVFEVRLPLEAS